MTKLLEDRFLGSRKTNKDLQIVRSLRSSQRGPQECLRIFGAAYADDIRKEWIGGWEVNKSTGHPCLYRLAGGNCFPSRDDGDDLRVCLPKGFDHTEMFCKGGKPAVLVTQPYELSPEILEEWLHRARSMNLTFRLTGRWAWHFPGNTVSAVWTRQADSAVTGEGLLV